MEQFQDINTGIHYVWAGFAEHRAIFVQAALNFQTGFRLSIPLRSSCQFIRLALVKHMNSRSPGILFFWVVFASSFAYKVKDVPTIGAAVQKATSFFKLN